MTDMNGKKKDSVSTTKDSHDNETPNGKVSVNGVKPKSKKHLEPKMLKKDSSSLLLLSPTSSDMLAISDMVKKGLQDVNGVDMRSGSAASSRRLSDVESQGSFIDDESIEGEAERTSSSESGGSASSQHGRVGEPEDSQHDEVGRPKENKHDEVGGPEDNQDGGLRRSEGRKHSKVRGPEDNHDGGLRRSEGRKHSKVRGPEGSKYGVDMRHEGSKSDGSGGSEGVKHGRFRDSNAISSETTSTNTTQKELESIRKKAGFTIDEKDRNKKTLEIFSRRSRKHSDAMKGKANYSRATTTKNFHHFSPGRKKMATLQNKKLPTKATHESVKEYLIRHKIKEMFDMFLASLVIDKPDSPVDYLLKMAHEMNRQRKIEQDGDSFLQPCPCDDLKQAERDVTREDNKNSAAATRDVF